MSRKKKKRHVALFYGHVASNIGDLAINTGTLKMLADRPEVEHVTVVFLDAAKSSYLDLARNSFARFHNVSFNYFQSHGEKSLRFLFNPREFLEETETEDCDLILLAAGEHLFSYVEVENRKSLFWRMFPAFAAKAIGIPCALLPSTLGPFESAQARALFKESACCINHIAVRDAISAEIIEHLVDPERLSLLLDPALSLPAATFESDEPTSSSGGRHLAMVIRADQMGIRVPRLQGAEALKQFEEQGFANSRAYQFSIKLCSYILSQEDISIYLFVQTDADQVLANHIVAAVEPSGKVSVQRPQSVDEYVLQLTRVDWVVASRFHALVLGLANGKSVYGVHFSEHGHKMPGMFAMLGISDRCYNVSDMTPEGIADRIGKRLLNDNGGLPRACTDRLRELKATSKEWLAELLQLDRTEGTRWPRGAAATFGALGQYLAGESIRLVKDKQIANANRAKANEIKVLQEKLEALNNENKRKLESEARSPREPEKIMRQVLELLEEKSASLQAMLEKTLAVDLERINQLQHEAHRLEERNQKIESDRLQLTKQLEQDAEIRRVLSIKVEGLEKDLVELKSKLDSKRQQAEQDARKFEALKRQVDDLTVRIAQADQEMLTAREEHAGNMANAEQRISSLRKQFDDLKGSTRYQLGQMIVLGYYRPLSVLGWPRRLIALYRRTRRARRVKAPRPLNAVEIEENEQEAGENIDEELAVTYRDGGAEAVVTALRLRETDDGLLARTLLKVGRSLNNAGYFGAEVELARSALALERSVSILRGYFWAQQRAGDLEAACEAILEIEGFLDKSPNRKERKRLSQLQRTACYQLSMSRHIPARRARVSSARKRVLCYVLHNSLPHSSGGYATRTHGLSLGLQEHEYEVHAITRPGYPVDIVRELSDSEVALNDVIDGIHYHRFLHPRSRGGPIAWYVRDSADHLERLFRELRPEAVIAASNHRVGIMALIAARRLGIPFIYEVRGWWEVTRQSRDPDFVDHPSYWVQRRLETVTCQEADFVFTLTHAMREELIARGVDSSKVEILPNSCDTKRFEPRPRDEALSSALSIPRDVPVIGYVGTFVDYEGLELLAEAAGLLKQREHEFRLLLVGNENASGSDRGLITEEVRRLAETYGFSDWLIMPGRVPHEAVESYYSLIDIAPFPRRPWPVCEMVSPMKPLEAMAMEKAVVVSSVAALQEMIKDGETGVVFEKGSAESLADSLAMLMVNPALRVQLGKAGREWVERERNWKHVATKAIDGLQELES